MTDKLTISAQIPGSDLKDSFDVDVTGVADVPNNSSSMTFDLDPNVNGGKLIEFSYNRSLNEIVGSWSAVVAGGDFKAGDSFSILAMQGGIILGAHKNPDGDWQLDGRDAGYRLMKTTPPVSELAKGSASAVINDLSNYCGMICRMTGSGLSEFNVRSTVSGSTCAESILELALMSGMIAYISNQGELIVTLPSKDIPSFDIVIDDSGSEIDLDGYASRTSVSVTRRKETPKEEGESTGSGEKSYFTGNTPPGSITRENINGIINYIDVEGKRVTGSYSQTILNPIGVTERLFHRVNRDGITITTTEEHSYAINSKTRWRSNTEYRLWAWAETGYKIVTISEGGYQGAKGYQSFKETKEEHMTRKFSIFNAEFMPPDWRDLDMVDSEELVISTRREGGTPILEGMIEYSPEYDKKVTRKYQKTDFGRGILASEIELQYDRRNVGFIAPLFVNGERLTFKDGRAMALSSSSGANWVRVETLRTIYEKYSDTGEPIISVTTEYDDNGAKWFFENKLSDTNSEEEYGEYQEQYAKFSDKITATKVTMGGSSLSTSMWQFLEQEGRTLTYIPPPEGGVPIQAENWYLNGDYAPSKYCPHFGMDNGKCSVWQINAINNFKGEQCKYNGLGWRPCVRAVAALEQARDDNDAPLLESPIIGIAKAGTKQEVWVSREVYIDDIISDDKALSIANTIAKNILDVKGLKGLRKTYVIPYSPYLSPNGSIVSVSHDWKGLTTTVSYRVEGAFPDCLIPASMAGVAGLIADRQNNRTQKAVAGVVKQVLRNGSVKVAIGGGIYLCSSKKTNIGENDSVLVSFPAGNLLHGIIIERI